MKLSEIGRSLITTLEGLSLKPYKDDKKDTVRIEYSIGYGHQIQSNEIALFSGITKEKAIELFNSDIKAFEKKVNDAVKVKLNQYQFDALVSFCYNLGHIANTGLINAVNARNNDQIKAEFRKWIYSGGKVNEALKDRREKEIEHFFRVSPTSPLFFL